MDEALRHYPGGSTEAEAASAAALGGDLDIIHPTWAWIEAQKRDRPGRYFPVSASTARR